MNVDKVLVNKHLLSALCMPGTTGMLVSGNKWRTKTWSIFRRLMVWYRKWSQKTISDTKYNWSSLFVNSMFVNSPTHLFLTPSQCLSCFCGHLGTWAKYWSHPMFTFPAKVKQGNTLPSYISFHASHRVLFMVYLVLGGHFFFFNFCAFSCWCCHLKCPTSIVLGCCLRQEVCDVP